jgi:hypothetical protein
VSQQIVLGLGSFGLALLLSALSLVVRSDSCTAAFRSETKVRALTLLKEWLSPEQRACYERFRYFDVVGSDTGTRYRIHHGTQTNIEELSHAIVPGSVLSNAGHREETRSHTLILNAMKRSPLLQKFSWRVVRRVWN